MLRTIAEMLAPLLPPDTEALAGLELGGVPIATMLSQVTGLPALFVRKEAKTYGTCRLAEGGEVDGRRLTVVEDVVTSGGQVVTSCGDLRERGAVVTHAVLRHRPSGGWPREPHRGRRRAAAPLHDGRAEQGERRPARVAASRRRPATAVCGAGRSRRAAARR